MAAIIDFIPLLAFFVAYQLQDLQAAVVTIMICQPASMVLLRLLGKPLNKIHYGSLVLVVVFGGSTLIVDDPIFIMVKPTVLYGGAGVALGVALLLGKNPAKTAFAKPMQALSVSDQAWKNMGWQWVALAIALAIANLVSALNLSEQAWVTLKTFAFPAATFVALFAQFFLLHYMTAKTPTSHIYRSLHKELAPLHVEVNDDSDEHLGHPEASQGGHYQVIITAEKFAGRSLLDRHRMIYDAIGDLKRKGIHALSIEAKAPDETSQPSGLSSESS